MNTPVLQEFSVVDPIGMGEPCQMLVLCEDSTSHEQAVSVCDRVLAQFGSELEFAISCWNFNELAGLECARFATETAANADIILFSMRGSDLPPVIGNWLEALPGPRIKTEGAMALILSEPLGHLVGFDKLAASFELVACRMGMDFLPLFSLSAEQRIESFRETNVTMFAAQSPVASGSHYEHWGLND